MKYSGKLLGRVPSKCLSCEAVRRLTNEIIVQAVFIGFGGRYQTDQHIIIQTIRVLET